MNTVKRYLPDIVGWIIGAVLVVGGAIAIAFVLSSCAFAPAVAPAKALSETTAEATVQIVCGTVTPQPTPTCYCPNVTPVPTTAATPTPTPVPAALWDPRLDAYGVKIISPADTRFRIIAVWMTHDGQWTDVPDWARQWQLDTLGGDHEVFGRCLDANGVPLGKTFVLTDGGTAAATPMPDGWANIPLAGQNWSGYPANMGPYSWTALKGDTLAGLGLPNNRHVSWFAVWQQVGAPAAMVRDTLEGLR